MSHLLDNAYFQIDLIILYLITQAQIRNSSLLISWYDPGFFACILGEVEEY